ncbi:MAG TPA: asparagine synthase-related protein [Natronosporangium sp.]
MFVGPDGRLVAHPLAATGPTAIVDLAGLARLFATPVLLGEFAPSSYWRGVELVWPHPQPASSDGGDLVEAFAAAVARSVGDADQVAVLLSGGIDSLAVLWHVLALDAVRQVHAFTANLVDDTRASAAAVVARLLDDLGLSNRVTLHIVEPDRCLATPAWSPYGPRLDALPAVNATIARLAAQVGANVMLSGSGADELMSAPRYAVAEVAALHGRRAARQYVSDIAGAGHGRTGEYAALAMRFLPGDLRTRAYAAVTWPEWCAPLVSPVVAPRWRDDALTWARQWVADVLDGHTIAQRTWAMAFARDCWWPRAYLPPAGPVAEGSPFCDRDFVAAVCAKPLGERYDPVGRSPYLRVKGMVAALFPPDVRAKLPVAKRYYTGALARAYAGPAAAPTAAAVGLLDPTAVAATECVATKMTTAAVEAWLSGAVAAGADVGSASQNEAI